MTPIDLDAWAVATPAGGIDDEVRTVCRAVLERRLFGNTTTGTIRTAPVVRLHKHGGVVDAHTASGDVYRLGESVWSKIGRSPSGSER
jgi:hypothetical protein